MEEVNPNVESNVGNSGDWSSKSHSSTKRPRVRDEEHSINEDVKKAKFTSQIPACLRILMSSKDAGPIIGKGGVNIKSLRDNYNASILLPDCSGPERILIISTTLTNACSILVDVLEIMDALKSDRDVCLKLLVHQSQAGAIIGKKGNNIKEFREKCRTMIKVYPECAPHSTERVVEIRGQPDIIASTVYSLLEFLQTSLPIGAVYPYEPTNYDRNYTCDYGGFVPMEGKSTKTREVMRMPYRSSGSRSNMYGGPRFGRAGNEDRHHHRIRMLADGINFGQNLSGSGSSGVNHSVNKNCFEGYNSFEDNEMLRNMPVKNNNVPSSHSSNVLQHEEIEVSQVTIPSELAGSIIGKGGMRIKQIRLKSGSSIDISNPQKDFPERIITIRGTTQQIYHAQYLLQTSVKKYSGRY